MSNNLTVTYSTGDGWSPWYRVLRPETSVIVRGLSVALTPEEK